MLPILLYEPLPLIYLCGGALILATGQSELMLISAFLFYWIGALIWILRSKNRRTDIRAIPLRRLFFFPEVLYEFRPFLYSFVGLLLLRNTEQTLWLVTGSILILWTIYCLYRRSLHRRHYNRHQHKNPKLKTRLY